MTEPPTSPADRLRRCLSRGVTAAPGCFNGLVARAAREAGFDVAYVSGGALSAGAGTPDIGVLTLDRFSQAVEEVAVGSGLPVIADADTGFGEAEMVRRTVFAYARAGAAALHLEDQVFPKRCGHLDGKSLIPLGDAATKIAWAAEAARDAAPGSGEADPPGVLVCARTDAFGVDGFDAAVERAAAYVEAGAEMIFPEGLRDEETFGRFADAMRRLPSPPYLLANMTEFGKTAHIPVARFGELGYHVVIFPVTTLRLAMRAAIDGLAELARTGTAAGLEPAMQTRGDLYDLLGYTPGVEWRYRADR